MKFREVSDVHTEFFGEDEIAEIANARILPPLPDDSQTMLILAGDIGSMGKWECLVNFLNAVVPRFRETFYIPGNHEYYHGDLEETVGTIGSLTSHLTEKLFFAGVGHANLDGHRLHMATLWTDFDKESPLSMNEAARRMNDYRLIMRGKRLALPSDMLELHKLTLADFSPLMRHGDIVVTHHSPSLRSIPQEYLTDRVNGAYHSDLEWLIEEKKPKFWFHGHTHTACDYMIGGTRIICNPYGYGNQYKKNGYNPTLVVEL